MTAGKSPWRAALLCILLGAGAGQIYNGQKAKGIAMLLLFFVPVAYVTYLIVAIYARFWDRIAAGDMTVVPEFAEALKKEEAVGFYSGIAGALWIISAVDAFVSAHMINRAEARASSEAGREAGPEN